MDTACVTIFQGAHTMASRAIRRRGVSADGCLIQACHLDGLSTLILEIDFITMNPRDNLSGNTPPLPQQCERGGGMF